MTTYSEETILYDRSANPNYIPRVAAVHDLCGYGKCSLGVAIPIISAGGCDVCPVPTGIFSSHTAFPGWYMHDTTAILSDYLTAWKTIDVELDAIYSGFLGAPEQVDIIRTLYAEHPKALRVVDPVMADHGKVYPTYTPELCSAMADLACDADILTPNLTEAAIILGVFSVAMGLSATSLLALIPTSMRRATNISPTCFMEREMCTAQACLPLLWPGKHSSLPLTLLARLPMMP